MRSQFFSSNPDNNGEMHLPVLTDGHQSYDRLGVAVSLLLASLGTDPGGIAGLAQRGPAESLVVFDVQVGRHH